MTVHVSKMSHSGPLFNGKLNGEEKLILEKSVGHERLAVQAP